MTNNSQNQPGQTVIINQVAQKSNGIGTAGFVLALIALFLGWIPIIGWVLWFLGFLFSLIGLFKKPAGLAIAGFIISLINIILLILVFGAFLASF
jgi:hypothetical protein